MATDFVTQIDTSTWDALIAKLEEARLLLLEIEALLVLEIEALLVPEDADGLNPPPSTDTPA